MNLKTLQKAIFYLILFLIPCNLAKHFIFPFSYVSGILVDYLIPTVYLTDILIFVLLYLWLVGLKKSKVKSKKAKLQFKTKKFILLIILLVIINLFVAQNRPVAFYKLIKLTEFSFFALWIKSNINIKKDISKIAQILAFSVLWQSILVIAQWFNQGSIAGFWFFGEQPFGLATIGIKKISFFGQLKVVPMGTFTHPNVLAAFLVISLTLILYGLSEARGDTRRGAPPPGSPPWVAVGLPSGRTPSQLIPIISLILSTITLFLTFSLSAWLAFILLLGFLVIRKFGKIGLLILIGLVGITIYFAGGEYSALPWAEMKPPQKTDEQPVETSSFPRWGGRHLTPVGFWEPTSFIRRSLLNQIALKMFLDHPLFGIGLNNFIPNMEKYGQVVLNYRFLQPVHNVYLLVLAETGIFGLLVAGCWLLVAGKNLWRKSKFIVSLSHCFIVSLFLALFDHYFFTIQQGLLLAALVFGLTGAATASSPSSATATRKSARRTNSRSPIRRRKS